MENTRRGLSMSANEFIHSTLFSIRKQSSPDPDFKNWSRIVTDFPANTGATLLDQFIRNPEWECCNLLVGLVDHWIQYAAEEFPKSVSNLSGAKIKFQAKKRSQKEVFVKR